MFKTDRIGSINTYSMYLTKVIIKCYIESTDDPLQKSIPMDMNALPIAIHRDSTTLNVIDYFHQVGNKVTVIMSQPGEKIM